MTCPTSVRLVVSSLCMAAAAAQSPNGEVRLRLRDPEARPVAGASVWTCPQRVWGRRTWVPPELWPFFDNQYEVLRRVGQLRTAGQDGELVVARESVIAVQSGDLAGFAVVGADAAQVVEIRVDDRRWTIELRDGDGKPVADIPIAIQSGQDSLDSLSKVALGLTDAAGRLVVRAPGCIRIPEPAEEDVIVVTGSEQGDGGKKPPVAPAPPKPRAPTSVFVVVDGFYMPLHGVALRLDDPQPTVNLTMPPATLVEVHLPDWNGPIAEFAFLATHRKGVVPDESSCWRRGDRLVGLVGGAFTEVMVVWNSRSHYHGPFDVPRLPPGETFPIQLELAPEDIVLRARLHDALGKPVAATELNIRPEGKPFVTSGVRTDRAGRFALVLEPGRAAGTRVVVEVRASANPAHLGATMSFVLPEQKAGDRRDLGILILDTK